MARLAGGDDELEPAAAVVVVLVPPAAGQGEGGRLVVGVVGEGVGAGARLAAGQTAAAAVTELLCQPAPVPLLEAADTETRQTWSWYWGIELNATL